MALSFFGNPAVRRLRLTRWLCVPRSPGVCPYRKVQRAVTATAVPCAGVDRPAPPLDGVDRSRSLKDGGKFKTLWVTRAARRSAREPPAWREETNPGHGPPEMTNYVTRPERPTDSGVKWSKPG